MKEFFEEFAYMCSSSNTKSRGMYIFIAIALAVLALGTVASLVLFIVNTIKFGFTPLFLILFIVTLLILIGMIVWLKKS